MQAVSKSSSIVSQYRISPHTLGHFNQATYFDTLVKHLRERPGLTADLLATQLNVNVVLMKELLLEAELKGFLCRDESMEGVRYYENLISSYNAG